MLFPWLSPTGHECIGKMKSFVLAIFLAVGAVRGKFCPDPTSWSVFEFAGMEMTATASASCSDVMEGLLVCGILCSWLKIIQYAMLV